MNLGIVTHRVVPGDGQGRVNLEIARAALRRGHTVVLLADEVAEEMRTHPSVQWIALRTQGWPTEMLRNQIFAVRSARWLRQNRSTLDVLYVNGFITWVASDINLAHFVHHAWLPWITIELRRRPSLHLAYQWLYTVLNVFLERRAYHQAGRIVAVSHAVEQQLHRLGIPATRIQVIPNGVDVQEFRPASGGEDAALRQTLGLSRETILALFIGDLQTPRKNLETTLKALAQVPDVHLIVIGTLKKRNRPEGLSFGVLSPAVAARVHFLGFRHDVAALMRGVNFLIAPSRYEPFSLVVLEAMACGVPVIVARTVGAVDLVNAECGLIVEDPENVEVLASAMKQLAADLVHCARMGGVARAVAEQNQWAQMADTYLTLGGLG